MCGVVLVPDYVAFPHALGPRPQTKHASPAEVNGLLVGFDDKAVRFDKQLDSNPVADRPTFSS